MEKDSINELEKELKNKEITYGGLVTDIPRNKVSAYDHRTKDEIRTGGMTGGDRMSNHGYAKKYAEYLMPFIKKRADLIIMEVGILTGIGLAIWCDIFPKNKVIGLDIDLGHINNNMENLKNLGAFKNNVPELYEFDQLIDNTKHLDKILNGKKIDIFIDDGLHSDESILSTLKSVKEHLSENFVYLIEDNDKVHEKLRKIYPQFNIDADGELTILKQTKDGG